MIRFYLGQEPILPQVQTYVCARESDCRYVLDHIDDLVVKAVNEAGGYGMLMGPVGVEEAACGIPRADPIRTRATTSRSRASSCRDRRPGRARGSSRVASTCGRSS
jgi:hypothetical protein